MLAVGRSKASSAARLPASPIACTPTWKPFAKALSIFAAAPPGVRTAGRLRRRVRIGRQQRRAAAAQRAVGVQLHRAHVEDSSP
jgi:hypothetical protein